MGQVEPLKVGQVEPWIKLPHNWYMEMPQVGAIIKLIQWINKPTAELHEMT